MAKDFMQGAALSYPRPYMMRMFLFLALVGFLLAILSPQLKTAYFTNPGLNTLIIGVLVLGILYAFRQILVLGPEIRWVNTFRRADPGLALPPPPRLLAPMATMLGERKGRLQVGADADIVMFDPVTLIDRATFSEMNRPSDGMVHVLVNGTPVIANRALVEDAAPGRPIRRGDA